MSKEKQILHLRSQGYSQRKIADTLKVSRNTVSTVFKRADQNSLSADKIELMDDLTLQKTLFPKSIQPPTQVIPDYGYVHKELLKDGVTLKLLWEEYAETCRQSHQPPFMYSQFCKLYNDYVNQHRLILNTD